MTPTNSYRLGLTLAAGTLLMLVFAAAALGIIGDGGRPDRMYLAVLLVCIGGAVIVRLRARGMAWVLAATAVVPVVLAVIALATGMQDEPGASVVDIVGVNAMFAVLFGASAWLFDRAAGAQELTRAGRS